MSHDHDVIMMYLSGRIMAHIIRYGYGYGAPLANTNIIRL